MKMWVCCEYTSNVYDKFSYANEKYFVMQINNKRFCDENNKRFWGQNINLDYF